MKTEFNIRRFHHIAMIAVFGTMMLCTHVFAQTVRPLNVPQNSQPGSQPNVVRQNIFSEYPPPSVSPVDANFFAPSATSNLLARVSGNSQMSALDGQMVSNPPNLSVPENSLAGQAATYEMPYTSAMPGFRSPVAVSYGNWFDAARNRSVPVKIYLPTQPREKCPVIVFSHGLGGSNEKCAYLGQTWASQGFVSVHIQHLGIDEQVWKRKIRPIKELKDVYGQQWSGRTQANDVRFVLDRLEGLAEGETSFGQMLDMSRVGVAGYDLGGLAAMLVAGQMPPDQGYYLHDPRVKAIVVMSPPVVDQTTYPMFSYGGMNTPALFFTGTEDDGVVGTTKAWQRRIPFDHMQGNDRYLITYQGAGHMIYGGHILASKNRDDQKFQTNVAQASALFWRAYLNGDQAVYAYFQGQSLGGISGALGRVERRLGGNADIAVAAGSDIPEGDIVPASTNANDTASRYQPTGWEKATK